MRRIKTLNDLALLRIPTMSTAAVSGVVESLGESGSEGTSAFGAEAGVVGAVCTGAEAGDSCAKMVVEYKRETSSASDKDKRDCFFTISILVLVLLWQMNANCWNYT